MLELNWLQAIALIGGAVVATGAHGFKTHEPINPTSAATAAMGRSGYLLLERWPAPLLNPAWLPPECSPYQTNPRHRVHHGFTTRPAIEPKTDPHCDPPKVEARLPVLETSEGTAKLVGISGSDRQIEFLLDNLGQPLSVGASTDVGLRLDDGTMLVVFRQYRARSLVFNDLSQLGLETIDVSLAEVTGFGVQRAYRIASKWTIGIQLFWLQVRAKNLTAPILDAAAVKQIRNIGNLNTGRGLGVHSAIMYRPHHRSFAVGIIARNIGDTSFDPLINDRPVPHFSQEVTLAWERPIQVHNRRGGLSLAYNDVFTDYESNPLKKMHAGAWFNPWAKWRLLGGLNQGNGTLGIGWDAPRFALYGAAVRDELGDKIGFRSDQQYIISLRFGF